MKLQVKKYIFIFASLIFSGNPCYASTCHIVNFMDKANGLINDVTEQVKGYADTANGYIQGKIGSFGDINAVSKKTEKVKKTKQRLEKAQQKAKKLQAAYNKAKEKKAALEDEINKVKDKANKIKSQYDEYQKQLAEAKSKIDAAKDNISDVMDKVDDIKDKASEVAGAINDAKDKAEKLSNEIQKTNNTNNNKQQGAVGTSVSANMSKNNLQSSFNTNATKDVRASSAQVNVNTTLNTNYYTGQSYMTQIETVNAITQITSEQSAPYTEITFAPEVSVLGIENPISANDVIESVENSDEIIVQSDDEISELSLEEQLENMSDSTETKVAPQKKAKLEDSRVKKGSRSEFVNTKKQKQTLPEKR